MQGNKPAVGIGAHLGAKPSQKVSRKDFNDIISSELMAAGTANLAPWMRFISFEDVDEGAEFAFNTKIDGRFKKLAYILFQHVKVFDFEANRPGNYLIPKIDLTLGPAGTPEEFLKFLILNITRCTTGGLANFKFSTDNQLNFIDGPIPPAHLAVLDSIVPHVAAFGIKVLTKPGANSTTQGVKTIRANIEKAFGMPSDSIKMGVIYDLEMEISHIVNPESTWMVMGSSFAASSGYLQSAIQRIKNIPAVWDMFLEYMQSAGVGATLSKIPKSELHVLRQALDALSVQPFCLHPYFKGNRAGLHGLGVANTPNIRTLVESMNKFTGNNPHASALIMKQASSGVKTIDEDLVKAAYEIFQAAERAEIMAHTLDRTKVDAYSRSVRDMFDSSEMGRLRSKNFSSTIQDVLVDKKQYTAIDKSLLGDTPVADPQVMSVLVTDLVNETAKASLQRLTADTSARARIGGGRRARAGQGDGGALPPPGPPGTQAI